MHQTFIKVLPFRVLEKVSPSELKLQTSHLFPQNLEDRAYFKGNGVILNKFLNEIMGSKVKYIFDFIINL